MATTATAPRGSGLYLRNQTWWVRVRTPAALEPEKNGLRRFRRFSTGTTSFPDASRAAAHVRAALDRGFALARLEIGTLVVDAVQIEAMLTRLAQNALAAAEASRALAGVRDAARVAEACRRHEEDLLRWRDALARNEFSQLSAKVGLAAQEAGVPASAMASPIVMRDAARTLAAVAEENISREHGVYAGDRARLSARLDAAAAPSRAFATSLPAPMPVAVAATSTPLDAAPALERAASPNGNPVAEAPVELPKAETAADPRAAAIEIPVSSPALEDRPADIRTDAKDRQIEPAEMLKASAEPVAKTPRAPRKTLTPKSTKASSRRRATPRAPTASERLAQFRTPEMTEIRKLQGEALWDLPLDKAIDLERGVRSKFGTHTSWIEASQRGFDAMAKLATTWFAEHLGAMPRVRDVTRADLEMFVEDLSRVPNNWNKGEKVQGTMHEVIAIADEADEKTTLRIELQALELGWSEDRWEQELRAKLTGRLAPATQYKHQSYLKGVFSMIASRSEIGRNPMEDVIWSKKHLQKLKAEQGETRTALGPEGRAALFSTSVFTSPSDDVADALFWSPLLSRFGGERAEEILQLAPEDVKTEDGVVIFDIHAGPGNSLKSPSAARKIPVHDELLRLGIVALAEHRKAAGETRLFEVKRGPLGSFSSWFSKRYHNYRVSKKIYVPGKDFHSLRKDFYQALRSAEVDYPIRVHLMGHALKDVSETNYGPAHQSLADLKRYIDLIPADTLHIRPRL